MHFNALGSLLSRCIKGRGWGRKRIWEKKWSGRGEGKRKACYKDPYWFIPAVVGSHNILIG